MIMHETESNKVINETELQHRRYLEQAANRGSEARVKHKEMAYRNVEAEGTKRGKKMKKINTPP